MTPQVRCAWKQNGNIEAAISLSIRMELCSRTGEVISSTVREGTDNFRWLVRAARNTLLLQQENYYV